MGNDRVIVTEGQDYDSINRNAVMDIVIDGLGDNLVRGWRTDDNEGPRGGMSSRLYAVVEVNGIMVPVAINVYSDAAIESQVKKKIGEDKRSDRIRAALESAPKEIPAEEVHEGFSREELDTFNMASLQMMLDRAGFDHSGLRYKQQLIDAAYELGI